MIALYRKGAPRGGVTELSANDEDEDGHGDQQDGVLYQEELHVHTKPGTDPSTCSSDIGGPVGYTGTIRSFIFEVYART